MIAFGPVPSRRLGRSLGVNNIPPKICTYSCVYCQLGHALSMQTERQCFYHPDRILRAVREKVAKAQGSGELIDYLTFVPDGEPTLDVNLGREIEGLRSLGIKTAVISNASLIWREDVREELAQADWVSLKLDAASTETWRRVNRPQRRLQLDDIREGMLAFASEYDGILATETMLIAGINDGEDAVTEIADFLARLQPDRCYLSIPTRPPAEAWARAANEETINQAYQIVSEHVDHVEYLIGYEGNAFAFTGDIKEDLLSITSVHPMRKDAVRAFLKRAGGDWDLIYDLIDRGQLVEVGHGGHHFYLRKLDRPTLAQMHSA